MTDPTDTTEPATGLGKLEEPTTTAEPAAEPAVTAQTPTFGSAPKDAPDKVATGYSAYDVTLARFVGGVHKNRKDAAAAGKDLSPESHTVTVVRV